MRFIEKEKITDVFRNTNLTRLRRYVTAQLAAQPNPLHPSFNLNRETRLSLIRQLLSEQKGLCCYCLQQLEEGDFHIEHLAPQSAFLNEEVNYYNLFLSCGSDRIRKNHCGQSKDNNLIPKIISSHNPNTHVKCEDLFKYNLLGEILPKEGLDTMINNYRQFERLNRLTKSLISTIDVLNLNCEELKVTRRRILNRILELPDDRIALERLSRQVLNPDPQTGFLAPFCELSNYFIKMKIDRLN